MKLTHSTLLGIQILISIILVSTNMYVASAASFTLSETFSNGDIFRATFDGTSNGAIVTQISKVSASIDGQPMAGAIFIGGDQTGPWIAGNAQVGFSQVNTDIIFVNSNIFTGDNTYSQFFIDNSFSAHAIDSLITANSRVYDILDIPEHTESTTTYAGIKTGYEWDGFQVTQVSYVLTQNAVPEPATLVLMGLGFAILALRSLLANGDSVPWSIFNRHRWSVFSRREQVYCLKLLSLILAASRGFKTTKQ